jgi:hypothetical protein
METIKELINRKLEFAKEDYQKALANKAEILSKQDQIIAFTKGRIDMLESLQELNWKVYAKNELEEK